MTIVLVFGPLPAVSEISAASRRPAISRIESARMYGFIQHPLRRARRSAAAGNRMKIVGSGTAAPTLALLMAMVSMERTLLMGLRSTGISKRMKPTWERPVDERSSQLPPADQRLGDTRKQSCVPGQSLASKHEKFLGMGRPKFAKVGPG